MSAEPQFSVSGKCAVAWIVEDDPASTALISRWLKGDGVDTRAFSDGASFLSFLESGQRLPDVIYLDLSLPGIGGLDLLSRVRSESDKVPIVVITSDESIDTVARAVRLGAYEYLSKKCDQTRFSTTLRRALEHRRLNRQIDLLERNLTEQTSSGIVGSSEPIKKVLQAISGFAQVDVPVLLTGETGTGKELAAHAIHQRSRRSSGPFIAINCAAVPASLLESELFGHEKGAFTGALSQHLGVFERANNGTLFLDKIGELPLQTQAALLRVIQERKFYRVGGHVEVSSNFRLISATNRSLDEEVRQHRFRADLYYRLAVGELSLPPLRERLEDLRLLIQYFLAQNRHEDGSFPEIAVETIRFLEAHSWPGNVRELKHSIDSALVVSGGQTLMPSHFPKRLTRSQFDFESHGPRPAVDSLAELERDALVSALSKAKGNITSAARALGIGRATLYRKLKKYGLTPATL